MYIPFTLINYIHVNEKNHFIFCRKTGLLVIGPDGSLGVTDYIKSLASSSLPHEVFSGEEANRRYPHELKLPARTVCVLEENGGIIFASKALAAFQV